MILRFKRAFASAYDSQSLTSRLLRGATILGCGSAAEQGLRFVRNIVLARLLAPEAFGLMALTLSVCSLFQVLTGLGIKESVVQCPRGTERSYLNGAWWLAFLRGVSLYLLAFASAPLIARFYDAPALAGLLRVAFLSVLAQGALSAGAFVAIKRMQYRKWVLIQQGGGIIGILTTLCLGFWLRGVWALVIGYATEGLVRCLLSYLICPFRPRWSFETQDLKALLRFAGGMFGLPFLMLIYTEGATFALGKMCTKTELGIYAMALTLARVPTMFSGQLVDLLMPAFSEIQNHSRRVNDGILKITTLVALIGIPAAGFVAVFSQQILAATYGAKYAGGSFALTFLFVNELLTLCSIPIATVFMAMGQPALLRRFSGLRAVLITILLWPAIKLEGLTGAACVPLVAMAVTYGWQLAQLRHVTSLRVHSYVEAWARGLLTATPFILFWMLTKAFFSNLRPLTCLAAVVLITALIIVAGLLSAYRKPALRQYFWPFVKQL